MTIDTAAALARLRRLHRDGALAERFDEVGPLLAAMSAEDAARAARLLARADLDTARELHPSLPAVRVTVTGHGTLEALRVALVGELARHGYVPSVRLTGFGSYVFELGDPGSELYAERPDLVVCVLDHATVFDEVSVPFTAEDVERVLAGKIALWRGWPPGTARAVRGRSCSTRCRCPACGRRGCSTTGRGPGWARPGAGPTPSCWSSARPPTGWSSWTSTRCCRPRPS